MKENEKEKEILKRLSCIGLRIREVRRLFNLTQKEVAENLGINQMTVSRFEQGKEVSEKNFVLFLDFYSKYINIDYLFADKFDLINDDNVEQLMQPLRMETIVKGNLEEIRRNLNDAQRKVDVLLNYTNNK